MSSTCSGTSMNVALVTTAWLMDHLGDANIRLSMHAYETPAMRPPAAQEEFAARHIPGAVFFDVDRIADQSTSLPHMISSEAEFGQLVSALGISNDDFVVVYDAGNYSGAPRAWWMFRLYGHAGVKVLDGGLKKWLAEGRPVDDAIVTSRAGNFAARFDARGVRRLDQILANLDLGGAGGRCPCARKI